MFKLRKKQMKKLSAMVVAMGMCIATTGMTAQAGATASFNFTVKTSGSKGTASSETATKTASTDYAVIHVGSISNNSYGVLLRVDKGTASSRSVATSEQKFTGIATKNSYYKSGMKSVGSSYVAVGRLPDGAPNITVKGYETP